MRFDMHIHFTENDRGSYNHQSTLKDDCGTTVATRNGTCETTQKLPLGALLLMRDNVNSNMDEVRFTITVEKRQIVPVYNGLF